MGRGARRDRIARALQRGPRGGPAADAGGVPAALVGQPELPAAHPRRRARAGPRAPRAALARGVGRDQPHLSGRPRHADRLPRLPGRHARVLRPGAKRRRFHPRALRQHRADGRGARLVPLRRLPRTSGHDEPHCGHQVLRPAPVRAGRGGRPRPLAVGGRASVRQCVAGLPHDASRRHHGSARRDNARARRAVPAQPLLLRPPRSAGTSRPLRTALPRARPYTSRANWRCSTSTSPRSTRPRWCGRASTSSWTASRRGSAAWTSCCTSTYFAFCPRSRKLRGCRSVFAGIRCTATRRQCGCCTRSCVCCPPPPSASAA